MGITETCRAQSLPAELGIAVNPTHMIALLLIWGQNIILAISEGSTTTHQEWGIQGILQLFNDHSSCSLYPSQYMALYVHLNLQLGIKICREAYKTREGIAMRTPCFFYAPSATERRSDYELDNY
jgi:hypothetical protein